MTGTQVAISILVAAAVLLPLAYFTDILTGLPSIDLSVVDVSYWKSLEGTPQPPAVLTLVLVFAGPILIFFLLLWYLWLQRNKEQVMLAIYAKAMDVHAWLQEWALAPQSELPERARTVASRAGKIFRKLDRLLSMQHRRNWRLWYSLYLVLFYFFNASKLSAFREVRVEPPPEEWPPPDSLATGASRDQVDLVENAVAFSDSFVDGAKAWTGLEFFLHTMIGCVFGGMLAAILGGATAVAIVANTGPWTRELLLALTFSVGAGFVASYLWQRVANIAGRMQRGGGTAKTQRAS